MLVLKILGIAVIVIVALMILLFIVYFFNLDMKLAINVIAPFLEKHYDKIKKDQYV